MGIGAQRVEREAVRVDKSIVDVDDESQLVDLELGLRETAEGPVRAVVTDPVPETHSLRLDDTDGAIDDRGGTITVEQSLDPGEVRRVGYQVVGPAETTLPVPSVVVETATTGQAPTRIEWTDPTGAQTDLAAPVESGVDDQAALALIATPETKAAQTLQGVAIGVILTADNEDAVLRTVLRAGRRGHTVLATTHGVTFESEAVSLLESLGAVVLAPPSKWASHLDLHRLLSGAARERGLSGIVLQSRECPRIDYVRTATAFERADYEVIAIPELWRESPDNPSVVVGIPAYNAADSIGDVVERALPFAAQVLVVDDGSRDETAQRAREAGATVVSHDRNRGYGGALKTLFREADRLGTPHLVVIDADGQHDPADVPTLVSTQSREDVDIVIGSRYVGERGTRIPFVRALGLAVINNLTNASLGRLRPSGFIRDTQSGYRAYSRAAIRSLAGDSTIGDNMGASTDILYHAHRNRLSVSEVATTISYDVENASSQGSFSHGMDLLRNIFWTVEYGRPLLVLGMPGAVTTLLGVAASVLLVSQYVESGFLQPAALAVAVLFALGGLLVCVTALMMHVLNNHPTFRRLRSEENR